MAGQWNQRRSQPQSNGQELWAKDRVMASQNALNSAIQIAALEFELAKFAMPGESPFSSAKERVMELYEELFNTHLQKGGDVGAAVATVTQAFPGSQVGVESPAPAVGGGQYTQQASGGPGDTAVTFGKYQGMTIAQVYAQDPSYIRNYLVEKAREADVRDACRAFLAQVDAA